MASLTNQKISNSYLGLLNTTSNGVLTSSLAQITDGNGNGSPIYLSTAALNLYNKYTFPDAVPASGTFLKATDGSGTLAWVAESGGDVKKTGTITINTIAVWNDATETLRSEPAMTINPNGTISLTQPNSSAAATGSFNIGGGNIATVAGSNNAGFGNNNLANVTSGGNNVAIGNFALQDTTIGSNNTAVGTNALADHTEGDGNVAVGAEALTDVRVGGNNTAVGRSAGANIDGTSGNTVIGKNAGFSLDGTGTQATNNTFIGVDSGTSVTSGSKNVILGSNSGGTIATSSNNIIISDGDGNARIQVDSSGKVGIASGTTSLVYPLEVYGGNGDAIIFKDTTNTVTTWLGAFGGAAVAGALTASDDFALYAGGAEKVRITSGGNVGIGITSPTSYNSAGDDLVVGSTTNNNNGITIVSPSGGSANDSRGNIYFADATNDTSGFITYKHRSDAEQMLIGVADSVALTISSGGNVGVGTSSPDGYYGKKLVVACPDEGGITITTEAENDGTKQYICFADNDNDFNGTLAGYISFDHATNQMSIGNDAGNDRILISTGGNVGVGVSPNQKFEVSGGASQFNGGGIDGTFGDAILFGNTSFSTVQKNRIRSTISAAQANNKLSFETSTGTTGSFNNSQFVLNGDNSASFSGSVSKASGSFKIDHPLEDKKDTHHLVHSFVESPQANNIYRGNVNLENGTAQVNLDEVSTMTEGTFILLNTNIHCYTSNESDWDAVKGSVSGNILTIECQNNESNASVNWLVIGERHDEHMLNTNWTDKNGKVIVEPIKD